MKHSRRKWVIFGISVIFIAAGSWAMLKLMSVANEPAPTAAHTAPKSVAPVENRDHELKELGVQLKKKPGHVPILMRRAQIHREAGKLDDAIADWREILRSEPDNAEAHLELGRALYEKGDVQASIAETQKVLQTSPNQVDALYNLGAIYANLGNVGQARSYWNKAVAADPKADSSRKAREALTKIGAA